MSVLPSALPNDIDKLKTLVMHYANGFDSTTEKLRYTSKKLDFSTTRIEQLKNEAQNLKGQLSVLKRLLWKPKTEKLPYENPTQALLFNELEEEINKSETKQTVVKGHIRSGKKSGRKPISDKLIRKDIIHDLSEEEKETADGKIAVKIGEEVSEKLVIIPAQAWVERHIRYKYKFGNKFGNTFEEDVIFKTAKMPPCILPKTMATPELLAYIVTSKFCDHLPLYRLEKIMKRSGVSLTRATMSNWLIKMIKQLDPLLTLFLNELKKGRIVSIDETPLQVIKEEGRTANQKSYMWLFIGGTKEKPVFYYHYDPSRSSNVVSTILGDYKGTLGSDGFSAYKKAAKDLGLSLAGCNAHARRKFKEAHEQAKSSSAILFLRLYQKLFKIEKEAKNKKYSTERITKLRQEKSAPIMNEMFDLLREYETKTPPSFPLGKAISYTLNNWKELTLFLTDGNIPIDNNHVERGIKPFVIGRKNWMFSFSANGAKGSAAYYSFIETAKANGLDVYLYLRYLFKHLPYCKNEADYLELLPNRITMEQILDSS